MKAYFIQLFNYDHHTNKQIVDAILANGKNEKATRLMAHLLSAQQVWLGRCKGEPIANPVLWPDRDAEELNRINDMNHHDWLTYLETLNNTADFDRILSYKTSTGIAFDSKIVDILAHIINHGTHHRAQAGRELKLVGATLPITDLIFYIRSTAPTQPLSKREELK